MKFKILFIILVFICSGKIFAQNNENQSKNYQLRSLSSYPKDKLQKDDMGTYYYDEQMRAKIYEIDGEVVVVIDQLALSAKPKFNNELDKNYYFFLNKKLNRVYPLFLTALQEYRNLESEISSMNKSDSRRYIKEKQEKLAAQYETKLKDLTVSEGRVFAKLMSRATGKTVYEIIKNLRGGWSAFWWNVKGNIADVDIDQPYNPHEDRDDEFIESLLQSSWNLGYLKPYEGYQSFQISK